MYVFWFNFISKLGHLVQEQPFCHCASSALTVLVSGRLYGPRQPVCCLFATSIGRLHLCCVYLLLVSQRKLGRLNCEFIPGRGVKPVRMDTPPRCRLIVFLLSYKADKGASPSQATERNKSRCALRQLSTVYKEALFLRILGCHFFNFKVLQLCILMCSQVLSCDLMRRTLQGS